MLLESEKLQAREEVGGRGIVHNNIGLEDRHREGLGGEVVRTIMLFWRIRIGRGCVVGHFAAQFRLDDKIFLTCVQG